MNKQFFRDMHVQMQPSDFTKRELIHRINNYENDNMRIAAKRRSIITKASTTIAACLVIALVTGVLISSTQELDSIESSAAAEGALNITVRDTNKETSEEYIGAIAEEDVVSSTAKTSQKPTNETAVETEIAIVQPWNTLDINQKYYYFTYNDNEFLSAWYSLPAENVSDFIGTATIKGYDEINNKDKALENVSLYKIKSPDLNTDAFLAVKLEDKYYIYYSSTYEPKTLGDLIDDFALNSNLTIFDVANLNTYDITPDTASMSSDEYTFRKDMTNYFIGIFNEYRNAEFTELVTLETQLGEKVSEKLQSVISLGADTVMNKNFSIDFTNGGYIITNITRYGSCFYIGEENVNKIVKYIKENADKTVYNDTTTYILPSYETTMTEGSSGMSAPGYPGVADGNDADSFNSSAVETVVEYSSKVENQSYNTLSIAVQTAKETSVPTSRYE